MQKIKTPYARRFRGLMPVVIDVETSGLNPAENALLEIAMVTLGLTEGGEFYPQETTHFHIEPFEGAVLDPKALEVTGIDPFQPLRFAVPEDQVMLRLFAEINKKLAETGCYRAVLVGHNAWFDLSFILEAVKRSGIKELPLHAFTTFDTASLSAVALGETVLARAVRRARISFDVKEAHSALYDTEKTAELFCYLVNRFKK